MSTVMMACGHAANAIDQDGNPVCAICVMAGKDDSARRVAASPDLTGRKARCSYARRPGEQERHRGGGQYASRDFPSTVDSSLGLAFFAHKPDQAEDEFYCGCWGWD